MSRRVATFGASTGGCACRHELALGVVAPVNDPSADGTTDLTTDVRLARLHLRTGSTALARAELEWLARAGTLDVAAMADLAVARWRTSDLEGAAAAAESHLAAGGADGAALAVAAEAAAAEGRDDAARELVERALAATGDSAVVDAVLAGLPTNAPWPGLAGSFGDSAVGTTPADRLEAAIGDLAADEPARAAVRLALILRHDPDHAAAVLDAIGERSTASLDVVRGDALRILGRDADAERAFTSAEAGLDR